ncbi:MAG: VCBS repeat-containing protein, partial [Cylindrospermopsis raciborskii KL1]|uniref:FG-GAP-like repeat-containing protein n=1 Tax=Cylindrospermopsis raciborskii TaxID=77022 RepID=UPI001A30216E
KNTGSGFEEDTSVSLPGVYYSSVAWADYNRDEYQDFLLTGLSASGPVAKLYKNTGSGFEEDTSVSLPGVDYSSVAWKDYDGDEDPDLLLTGLSDEGPIAKLYENKEGKFNLPEELNKVKVSLETNGLKEDSNEKLVYKFTRQGDRQNPLTIKYRIEGTADNDDYTGATPGEGKITFPGGEFEVRLTLTPTLDNIPEPDEEVRLTLVSGDGYTIGASTPVIGTIQNDDLPGVRYSSVAWKDYDGDGYQDFLLTGLSASGPIAKLYKYNDESKRFEEDTSVSLPGVQNSSVAWADYDGNGKQDFLLTGLSASGPIAKLYKYNNESKQFEDENISLTGVQNSSVAWADYDRDGDQDFLLTGNSSNESSPVPIAKLYKNTGSGFKEDESISLTGVQNGSVAWSSNSEYLLLTGQSVTGSPVSKLYENKIVNGNRRLVTVTSVELPGVYNSSVAWADYDGNGKEDFLLTGNSSNESSPVPIAKLYKNTGSGFKEDKNISLTGAKNAGVQNSSVAWADYDGDKDQDFLLTGFSASGSIAQLYKNTGSGFEEDNTVFLPGLTFGSVDWGDYNGDNRPDLLLTGDSDSGPISKVYKNTPNGFTTTLSDSGQTADITLAVSPGAVKEGETLEYTFTRAGGDITKSLEVTYGITGTADKNDYTYDGKTKVSFSAGETKTELKINITKDTKNNEAIETVELTLLEGDTYTVGTTTPVKGIILGAASEQPPTPPIPSPTKPIKSYPGVDTIETGNQLSKLSYQYLDYNSPVVREKLVSALNLTNAGFTNQLGLYEVDDPNTGAVEGLFPGDPGYVQAALNKRVTDFDFKAGGSGGRSVTTNGVFTQNTPGGMKPIGTDVKYYAPFIIANIGTRTFDNAIEEIKDKNNSSANYQTSPVAYFSFGAANPDGANHIKYFGNNIFGFEDLPLNVSDRDFNDTVFSFG